MISTADLSIDLGHGVVVRLAFAGSRYGGIAGASRDGRFPLG